MALGTLGDRKHVSSCFFDVRDGLSDRPVLGAIPDKREHAEIVSVFQHVCDCSEVGLSVAWDLVFTGAEVVDAFDVWADAPQAHITKAGSRGVNYGTQSGAGQSCMVRCQAEGYARMPHVIQKTRNLAWLVEPGPDLIREGEGNASLLGCPAERPNVIGGFTSFIFAHWRGANDEGCSDSSSEVQSFNEIATKCRVG